MKPIFRNDPNLPLDINAGTTTAVLVTLSADTDGTAAVSGLLATSTVVAAWVAAGAGDMTDVSGDVIVADGIVTVTATASQELALVFNNA